MAPTDNFYVPLLQERNASWLLSIKLRRVTATNVCRLSREKLRYSSVLWRLCVVGAVSGSSNAALGYQRTVALYIMLSLFSWSGAKCPTVSKNVSTTLRVLDMTWERLLHKAAEWPQRALISPCHEVHCSSGPQPLHVQCVQVKRLEHEAKGAFTRVTLDYQCDWINQSEPCKQYLSMKVISGDETSWRRPTFVQCRWFTLVICDYDPCLCTPQITVSLIVQQCRSWSRASHVFTILTTMVFKRKDDHTQMVLDLLINQECLWDVKSENYRNRNIRDKALEEMVKELNMSDLPPFFNRLPRSLSWNRVNSIVHPSNSMSLIQSHWSSKVTRANAP
jgi:hypothetical protein